MVLIVKVSLLLTLCLPLLKSMDGVLCIIQKKFCLERIAMSMSVSLPNLSMDVEIGALLSCVCACVCYTLLYLTDALQ